MSGLLFKVGCGGFGGKEANAKVCVLLSAEVICKTDAKTDKNYRYH